MTREYLLKQLAKKVGPIEYRELLDRKTEEGERLPEAELQNILDSYK